jgi:hypothetical protein
MNKLRANCLNFMELLAQNIALISPTMTAALIVPLMFATTGNLSWLSYAVGTVMLLFVAFSLNQFHRRCIVRLVPRVGLPLHRPGGNNRLYHIRHQALGCRSCPPATGGSLRHLFGNLLLHGL